VEHVAVSFMQTLMRMTTEQELRPDEDHGDDVLVIRWTDTVCYQDDFTTGLADERATEVAVRMLDVGSGDQGCRQCAEQCVGSGLFFAGVLDIRTLMAATRLKPGMRCLWPRRGSRGGDARAGMVMREDGLPDPRRMPEAAR
jgi:hypothetical protein